MFFSRCLAVSSVVAFGDFSSPSDHLEQALSRNEAECRDSVETSCTYLHLRTPVSPLLPVVEGLENASWGAGIQ